MYHIAVQKQNIQMNGIYCENNFGSQFLKNETKKCERELNLIILNAYLFIYDALLIGSDRQTF